MGKLIIVTGAPASGKSTLAKALQNASTSFKLLSVDAVKIFLSESVGFHDQKQRSIMSETSRKIAFQLVDYAMSIDENVIFEHVFKPNSTNLFTQLLEKYPHYDVKLVKLVGNLDTLYDRYITRTFSSEKRHNCFEANSFQPNDEKYSKTSNIEPLSKEVYIDTLNQITSFHLKGVEEICLNTNNFFNDSSYAAILSAFK